MISRLPPGSLVLVLCVVGCGHSVDRDASTLPIAASVSVESGQATLAPRWWLAFGDAELDQHIERALTENYSLSATWARLAQARADARIVGADSLPNVSATADGSYRRAFGPDASEVSDGASWSAGVAASYEIDLWGSIRATKRGATANIEAARADLEAAAITLSAEVAIAWYRWVEASEQHRLRLAQTKTNEQILALVEARYSRGQVSAQDVFRQRQIVLAAKQSEIATSSEGLRWRNRLSTLISIKPAALKLPSVVTLPATPALPSVGTPVSIIERRPDLQAAYQRLRSADANTAAAVANRYPRLSLSASVGTSSTSVSDLFRNWLVTIGGNLLAPIFDGGRLKARAESARAAAQSAWFAYAQSALAAIAEVEDALVTSAELAAQTKSLADQVELARRGLETARAGYVAGRTTYIQTLDAVLTLQGLERSLLTSRRDALEARINLHRAVAGPLDLKEKGSDS